VKTEWTKEVPKDEGWYWIRYKGKCGLVQCPCQVIRIDSLYTVNTARNDSFNTLTRKFEGFTNATFWPVRIEKPE
jgi:hypothetical protein